MRVLLVSQLYRPHLGPRAFRWAAIAEHWARRGHDVHVVTGWQPAWPREELLDGVHVYRAGGAWSERLRSALAGAGTRPTLGPPLNAASGAASSRLGRSRSVLRRSARWVHDRIWKSLYWPDYAALWRQPALALVHHRLDLAAFDALISVSIPFSSHLVGQRLKARFKHLRWLCDVGDPFCFLDQTPPNNLRLYRGRNLRAESQVFQQADAVAVTTEQTAAEYRARIPASRGKLHVIGPLVTLPAAVPAQPGPAAQGTLKLVFVGTLYRAIRGPGPLLRLWSQMAPFTDGRAIELHFYGHLHDCQGEFEPYRQWLGQTLHLHGPVPRDEAWQAMRAADGLVNLGNTTRYQLPSKVVEYAATGKPVVNITSTADDSSWQFFARYPAAINVSTESAGSSEQAQQVARFLLHPPTCSQTLRADLLRGFELPSIAASYERLLGWEPALFSQTAA